MGLEGVKVPAKKYVFLVSCKRHNKIHISFITGYTMKPGSITASNSSETITDVGLNLKQVTKGYQSGGISKERFCYQ